ncbi:hypothetical protein SARC_05503 [Sphaeroforma arctica JP610]|uniref:Polysaccharide lyase 14 domain-containing protein n=1 Tax=Sphaeroforma arctica JP610 TaxID=667725 RepID=A0A0L0FZG0_9EUKA|nr:hypothetical protein SARC_05503 [Sphaeroforma arctica JP610]KNC82205.1 hypothetical protein SARC_05503 [Sphaeroforma arctica JP610]|eukprot:XP_014156107.1 hypothetical protein SARC_05503 [Sphaeroforma arctica JP610]
MKVNHFSILVAALTLAINGGMCSPITTQTSPNSEVISYNRFDLMIQDLQMAVHNLFFKENPTSRTDTTSSPLVLDVNYNKYNVGDEPDVLVDYGAPFTGCFGMFRDAKDCQSEKPNDSVVSEDPTNPSNRVMSIKFAGGVYGTDAPNTGGQFYSNTLQNLDGLREATLEYSVYFPEDFDFKMGGKLPGMHGGPELECSGGTNADGSNCFSTRLMWREDGEGEAYLYIPMDYQTEELCAQCAYPEMVSGCKDVAHCSLDRGAFTFSKGKWNTVKQYIRLNTVGSNDGFFKLYHNNNLVMNQELVYRTSDKVGINGFFFSTFFGGSSQEYAPKDDQVSMFKNIRLYAGEA